VRSEGKVENVVRVSTNGREDPVSHLLGPLKNARCFSTNLLYANLLRTEAELFHL